MEFLLALLKRETTAIGLKSVEIIALVPNGRLPLFPGNCAGLVWRASAQHEFQIGSLPFCKGGYWKAPTYDVKGRLTCDEVVAETPAPIIFEQPVAKFDAKSPDGDESTT